MIQYRHTSSNETPPKKNSPEKQNLKTISYDTCTQSNPTPWSTDAIYLQVNCKSSTHAIRKKQISSKNIRQGNRTLVLRKMSNAITTVMKELRLSTYLTIKQNKVIWLVPSASCSWLSTRWAETTNEQKISLIMSRIPIAFASTRMD